MKSESGHYAERKKQDDYPIGDRAMFMDWVIDNNHREFIMNRANKTAVKEYLDTNGALPPGIALKTFEKLSIKKRK